MLPLGATSSYQGGCPFELKSPKPFLVRERKKREMEYNEHGFLDELLALRSDHCETNIPTEMNGLYSTSQWNFGCFDNYSFPISSNSSFEELSLPIDQTQNCSFNNKYYSPFGDEFSAPENAFPITQEDYSLSLLEDEEKGLFGSNGIQNLEIQAPCKVEAIQSSHEVPNFNMDLCVERKNKIKKMDGQPSKNLMAERRRRKRLNDRLSMLRSVVPKISKMDRTSILGDTIDYMKELLETVQNLQKEIDEMGPNQFNLMSIFKDVKPNEVLVRNSPKFAVERRDMATKIEICCSGKPGLLLSTVTTLEALGLEIQQCVISCFNDFAMQASCSEELQQRGINLSPEDIKQALFRNAGYGGRCV